jgi:ferredoxin
MQTFRYLPDVTTLHVDPERCVGCAACVTVCPHGVLAMADGKARARDPDGCMECGACATNCPTGAVRVTPGVGCAVYIIQTWIKGKGKAGAAGGRCC